MQHHKVKALVENLMLCAVLRGIREALTAWDYVDEFELPKGEVNKQGSGSGAQFTKILVSPLPPSQDNTAGLATLLCGRDTLQIVQDELAGTRSQKALSRMTWPS